LAKTINCESRTADGEACNTCNSCRSFDNGNSLNVHELDAASNNSVDDMRDLMEQVRFLPQAGKYKVYIVDEVHMLTAQAFNAFLKTLEEPPAHAIFILATTEKHKILPTILSRCQIFDFKRITAKDTVEHLHEIAVKEHVEAEKAALHVIAQKSEGCLRDALSILDKIVSFTGGKLTYNNTLEHLNILDEDYYFKWINQMQQQQVTDALLLFDEINQKGFEGDMILEGFAECIRNVIVSKDARTAVLLEVAEDFKPKYIETAKALDTGWLIAVLNILSEVSISYKQAKNKKLHIELLLIKLCFLKQAIQLTVNDSGIEKKKLTELSKSVSFRALPGFSLAPAANKPPKKSTAIAPAPTAVMTVEEPKKELKKPVEPKIEMPVVETEKPITKLGSLNKIRSLVNAQNNNQISNIPLTQETLESAWEGFIQKLNDNKNHSAATNFKFANLDITGENGFNIITETNIQQKFIEAERSELIVFMQQYFNNKLLTYNVLLVEKENPEASLEPAPINTKAYFKILVETYPMIGELKEKLKLDLEF
jgi:DNA polymerase-3 subunit gamma/tau